MKLSSLPKGLVSALACVLLAATAGAAELPRSWSIGGLLGEAPIMQLPLADLARFEDQHNHGLGSHARNIKAVAPEGLEEFEALDRGVWAELPNGGHLWRLRIESPGASHHVLVFSDIRIPSSGQLHIYSPRSTQGFSICERDCMRVGAFDVPHSHKMTTPLIQGDVLELEYYQPHAPEIGSYPTLRILTVMQGVDGEMQAQKRRRRALLQDGGPRTPGTQFDTTIMQQTTDDTQPCTKSIECDPSWAESAKGVVSVYAVNTRIKALGLCTGSIVNAALGRRYLLTADHCFTNKKEISDFEYWLLIFNYEAPCYNQTAPPFADVLQGVKLLFYNSAADVLLLDVPSTIPERFSPFFLGFDAEDDAVPVNAVAIHHPHGNIKRISYANGSISTNFVPITFPAGEVQPTTRTHFQVIWTDGSTQGGSSGSPLIDTKTRRIVGVLTGGVSTCDTRSSPDYYGRLSRAWDNGLKRFLSNVPEDPSGVNKAGLDKLLARYAAQNVTLVTNYMDSRPKPKVGPVVNFFPTVQSFYNKTTVANATVYLTVPPALGDVMEADFAIDSLPGNPVNLTHYITIMPDRVYWDATNYSGEVDLTVDTSRLNGTLPGRLLRYDLTAVLRSSVSADDVTQSAMKGIIEEKQVKWSDYAPIMVTSLPFYIKAEKGAPITSPSGKALFEWTATRNGKVDFYICALSFGTNAIGERQRIGATVSVYQDGTFIWTLSHDPLALDPNCIHIVGATVFGGSKYHVVASDDNDFNAVLPSWGIREAYVGPANTLAQVLSGNLTFRTPQQSANAAAPTAAYNLTSARIATSIDTLAPGPAASSELGSYTLTATKRNGTALSNVQGPQFTTQYKDFPDDPTVEATALAATDTKVQQNATAAGGPPWNAPVPPGDRTTLYGSVMDRLTIARSYTGSPDGDTNSSLSSNSSQLAHTRATVISIPTIGIPAGLGGR